jgi:hypothetical protein
METRIIRSNLVSVLLIGLILVARISWAASDSSSSGAGALQSSNILNPNISVVGWFQGEAGHPHDPGREVEPALQLKEAELALQAIVDPWAKADFFTSFDRDGHANLEEGYLTWFHLPYSLSLRTGKFRSNFGPFNRTHPHDTPFATRPLAEREFLGEDGLADTGAGLSWQVPIPWFYLNTDLEVSRPPAASDTPSFDLAERRDLLYVGRMNGYVDLTDAQNLSFGGSYAYGPSGLEFSSVRNSSDTLHAQLYGLDLTYRWKDPARAIYRSLIWQTELLWSRHETSTASTVQSRGILSWIQYQFAQRWAAGGRYDFSQFATDNGTHEYGGLIFLTFSPSEFSHISLQGSHVVRSDGLKEDMGFLRIVFNIGPHGAHPF